MHPHCMGTKMSDIGLTVSITMQHTEKTTAGNQGIHLRLCSCSSKRCSGTARSATLYRRQALSLVSTARCTLLPARAAA